MADENDSKDKKEARTLAIVLLVAVVALAATALLAMPMLADFNAAYLASGVDLKEAAIIAFATTMVVLVIFAIAAGDGLLGELQFMLLGFFAFFVVLWLLIAWIF
jgi:hypothetical protein